MQITAVPGNNTDVLVSLFAVPTPELSLIMSLVSPRLLSAKISIYLRKMIKEKFTFY